MEKTKIDSVEAYYQQVLDKGSLRTIDHAVRWSNGTLQMLGINLGGKTKRSLARALPEILQDQLRFVFMPVFFRDTNISLRDFCNKVARRSRASSDPDLAKIPVLAVFSGLKGLIDSDLANQIRDDLSPELSKAWDDA